MQAFEWIIHGRVQGVGYRQATRRKALELGLSGKVLNRADGTVLIQVQGEPRSLAALRNWCAHGPPLARVERVEERAMEPSAYLTFDIGH